jgi:alpha-tubulin suppressor-like RCC1 family protein
MYITSHLPSHDDNDNDNDDNGECDRCGITVGGAAICFGTNTNGQATAPSGSFVQIGTGTTHSCALTSTRTIKCWGYSAYGAATPPTTGTYIYLASGIDHVCAITLAGTVVCWVIFPQPMLIHPYLCVNH